MSSITEYTELNRAERERLQRLVTRFDEDALRRHATGTEWSIADTLAHLAFYDRRAEVLMQKFAREGVGPAPYDFQTINDALLPLSRRIPPRAVAEEAIAAAEAADAVAASITESLLEEIRARNEVSPERWVHRKSHLDEIERTLSAQRL